MTHMAIGTDDASSLVRAAVPEQPIAPFVTRETGSVSFLSRVARVFGESNGNSVLAASSLDVRLSRSVTRLASELFFFVFRVSERLAHHCVLKMLDLIFVAKHACIAAGIFAGSCR